MSFLAPLYLLGGLAVIAPVLWHLIRRRPKSRVQFSSLMFLRPTPPRIAKRNRLDNWPLLLIRILALLLLAIAFARPLIRGEENTTTISEGRRIMVLVDTSASMQRTGLWDAALERVEGLIGGLSENDTVALAAFDVEPRILWSFNESARMERSAYVAHVRGLLASQSPGWMPTKLGEVLVFAADYASDDSNALRDPLTPDIDEPSEALNEMPVEIVLVSDLQNGSDIAVLQSFTWPDHCRLKIEQVTAPAPNNASAQVLNPLADEVTEETAIRVRVMNATRSQTTNFELAWSTSKDDASLSTETISTQVPAGESRVVRVPSPPAQARALVLSGDSQEFDNTWYIASPSPRTSRLLYWGPNPDERSENLGFYLTQAPLDRPLQAVATEMVVNDSALTGLSPDDVALLVIAQEISPTQQPALRQFVEQGGNVLVVLGDDAQSNKIIRNVAQWTETPTLAVTEAKVKDYALFAKIDFGHPLFTPLADPRFNDFSKIRTWEYRELQGWDDSWRELIGFDSKMPALLEKSIGPGHVWLMTMGWQPKSSQLALSTKFIPLLFGMVHWNDRDLLPVQGFTVGDVAPQDWLANPVGADGESEDRDWLDDSKRFRLPGVFTIGDKTFAVNLASVESDTDPLPPESLERLGVRLSTPETPDQIAKRERRIQDTELERRQGLWQWLLAAVLGLVGIESVLSTMQSRLREG